jgi:hypothetical protein
MCPGHEGEYRKYLKELADSGDFAALRAVYESGCVYHEWAAEQQVRVLVPDRAIAFCKGLPIETKRWRAAIIALQYHPKESVIGFIKEVVRDSGPHARAACYKLCLIAGWDDLAANAAEDTEDETFLGSPNVPDEAILGLLAEKYLKRVRYFPGGQEALPH